MKKWLFAVLLGTMLVLGACGGDENADENAANDDNATEENPNDNNKAGKKENDNSGAVDPAECEAVFECNCDSCHVNDLSGGAGPDLTSIGSDYGADEIADIIENGTDNGMPGGLVSGDDLDLLADWLSDMK